MYSISRLSKNINEVYGGIGGVGHLGVRLAEWAGAGVYACVFSSAKVAIAHYLSWQFCRSLRELIFWANEANIFDCGCYFLDISGSIF